jgi:hypothetical protein
MNQHLRNARRDGSPRQFFGDGTFRSGQRFTYDEQEARFHESEGVEEEYRKKLREARRQQTEVEEKKRKEQEVAKKLAEELKAKAKEKREVDEKTNQERIWKEAGAMTNDEKQKTCLHSEFWPRIQQKGKFKCVNCLQKRGPTAFKCPHCDLVACQSCNMQFRNNFTNKCS